MTLPHRTLNPHPKPPPVATTCQHHLVLINHECNPRSPRLQVDRVSGQLSDSRTRFLGTRAPKLFAATIRGVRCMLALSSRPWLGYSDQVGGPGGGREGGEREGEGKGEGSGRKRAGGGISVPTPTQPASRTGGMSGVLRRGVLACESGNGAAWIGRSVG